MDHIIAQLEKGASSAVVLGGGGYIGLEMTEALRARELPMVRREQPTLMPWLDPEMTRMLDYPAHPRRGPAPRDVGRGGRAAAREAGSSAASRTAHESNGRRDHGGRGATRERRPWRTRRDSRSGHEEASGSTADAHDATRHPGPAMPWRPLQDRCVTGAVNARGAGQPARTHRRRQHRRPRQRLPRHAGHRDRQGLRPDRRRHGPAEKA